MKKLWLGLAMVGLACATVPANAGVVVSATVGGPVGFSVVIGRPTPVVTPVIVAPPSVVVHRPPMVVRAPVVVAPPPIVTCPRPVVVRHPPGHLRHGRVLVARGPVHARPPVVMVLAPRPVTGIHVGVGCQPVFQPAAGYGWR